MNPEPTHVPTPDIVERLREPWDMASFSPWVQNNWAIRQEAADEIERLRTQNRELAEARRNLEVRLNTEIRQAGAEVERLRAVLRVAHNALAAFCSHQLNHAEQYALLGHAWQQTRAALEGK